MEFSVRIDLDRGIVIVDAVGALTRSGTVKMVGAARAAGASKGGLPILFDLRQASPGELSKADLFWMARNTPALRDGHSKVRIGTLFPAQHGGTARFWEDSYRNAGLDARAFEDEEEALDWLLQR